LNDRFLSPDLNVEDLVGTFERESREIAAQRDEIVAALGLEPGMRVADIGTSTGLCLEPFTSAVGSSGQVYAVDISPRLVEYVRERAQDEGWARVEPVLCTDRSCELSPASTDLAFVCDTYHHFEYPRTTLTSLFEAIAPGGRLVIVEFERIPGVSRQWVLDHVRAGRETFTEEIESAGFVLSGELSVPGLSENYVLSFRRP
jgi:ubiquinone/menaquinone biosynthesis C-methylase UbiE